MERHEESSTISKDTLRSIATKQRYRLRRWPARQHRICRPLWVGQRFLRQRSGRGRERYQRSSCREFTKYCVESYSYLISIMALPKDSISFRNSECHTRFHIHSRISIVENCRAKKTSPGFPSAGILLAAFRNRPRLSSTTVNYLIILQRF